MTRYCYLGGPITGLLFDQATGWREEIVQRKDWPSDWTALSPMRDKEHFRVAGPLPSTFDQASDAVAQDLRDIRQSDALIINLLGATQPSIGSMCELGYAHERDKFVIVVMEEEGNPHDHLFVHELASVMVPYIDLALLELRLHDRTLADAA